jgi:hypothetical protein
VHDSRKARGSSVIRGLGNWAKTVPTSKRKAEH